MAPTPICADRPAQRAALGVDVAMPIADIAGEAAATIRMPHRVPFGLHGNRIPRD